MKASRILTLTLLLGSEAVASSCGPLLPPDARFEAAQNVAIVRVVSAQVGSYTPEGLYGDKGKIERPMDAVVATAEVVEQLKGYVLSPSLIISRPPGLSGHVPIIVGQTYVVFAESGWSIQHTACHPLPLLHTIEPSLRETWRGL